MITIYLQDNFECIQSHTNSSVFYLELLKEINEQNWK